MRHRKNVRRIIPPERLESRTAPGAFLDGLLLTVFSERGRSGAPRLDEQVEQESEAAHDEEDGASRLKRSATGRLRWEMLLHSKVQLEKAARDPVHRNADDDEDFARRPDQSLQRQTNEPPPLDLDQLLAPLMVRESFRVAPVVLSSHRPVGGSGSGNVAPLSSASGGVANPANGTIAGSGEQTPPPGRTDLDAPEGEETNEPPVAYEDAYAFPHDGVLSVMEPGVLGNDDDTEGDPLTAEVVDGPTNAVNFQLFSDGSFTYEPPANWAGTDSFTYQAFDGTSYSNVQTVSIDVTNETPFAANDAYFTAYNGILEIDAVDGLLSNDDDGDGDPLAVTLQSGPTSGSFEYLNYDGSFKYIPDPSFGGTATFTYVAADGVDQSDPATVEILVQKVDATIHNGQEGDAVADDKEESVGAFTVVNFNDTDGDDIEDWMDDSVIATPAGRDEVDLMELKLKRPEPYSGGNAELVFEPGEVALWQNSTKGVEIPSSGGSADISFDQGEMEKSVWVEVIQVSLSLRDIELEYKYNEASDVINVTGVWAYLANELSATLDADVVANTPPWDEADVLAGVNVHGGTGVRPTAQFHEAVNVILQRWKILPEGVGDEPNVKVDITRRISERFSFKDENGDPLGDDRTKPFPLVKEWANDDSAPEYDESPEPNASSHMYVVDAPGLPSDQVKTPSIHQLQIDFDFEEFVRFKFDGTSPEGLGVQGSQGSLKFPWLSRIGLEQDELGNLWIRKEGAPNEIGPGHIPLNIPQ